MNNKTSEFLGLRTCIYKVDELTKAKAWYSKVFNVDPYFDEAYYVGFNIGGFELGLMPSEDSKEQKSSNVLTYWGVQDMNASYDRLTELGAEAFEEIMDVGDGVLVATVKDPWGNVLGLIYNPFFKAAT